VKFVSYHTTVLVMCLIHNVRIGETINHFIDLIAN
jgi:hypothetical protein